MTKQKPDRRPKAVRAREMHMAGSTVREIAEALNMEPTNVYKCFNRVSMEDRSKTYTAPPSGNIHNVFSHWVPKHDIVPKGSCVAWDVVDGQAVQCGVPCKGQLCTEHAERAVQRKAERAGVSIGARPGGALFGGKIK